MSSEAIVHKPSKAGDPCISRRSWIKAMGVYIGFSPVVNVLLVYLSEYLPNQIHDEGEQQTPPTH